MTLARSLIAQESQLLNCVHCGFCLPVCPTYRRLGDESDSPRGRLHLMRAVVEERLDPSSRAFQVHIDRCLGCRACETVCPSGVEFGHLLEEARDVTARISPPGWTTRLLVAVMGNGDVRRPVLALSRILRSTRLPALAARALPRWPGVRKAKLGMAMLAASARFPIPEVAGGGGSVDPAPLSGPGGAGNSEIASDGAPPTFEPAASGGSRPVRIAVLEGCVQAGLYGHVNAATARVLEANGFQIVPVPGQECCGAIHAHTGSLDGARELARRNVDAFEASGVELIAVNAAGCGATMKEYGKLLAEDAEYAERGARIAGMVRDLSEVLAPGSGARGAPLNLRVTYDAPCHLIHAQGISDAPIRLLREIPGVELAELERADECCGGAGLFGITHPELGGWIGRDKIEAVKATGAGVVATPNPGCMMQVGAGLRMEGESVGVVHPVELIDESYRRAGLYDSDG